MKSEAKPVEAAMLSGSGNGCPSHDEEERELNFQFRVVTEKSQH